MITVGLPAVKPMYLAEAIQSVLDQRFGDFELVISHDRGDERIHEIVSRYHDPRIRYFAENNPRSVVDHWNKVLSLASGDFFVLFADDDRYDPGFLEKMQMLTSHYPEVDIFHCRVRKIGPGGEAAGLTPSCPEFETGLAFILERLSGRREQFAPEFLVRTAKLRQIGGFVDLPLAWGSDDMTWFRLAREKGIACHPEPLVGWRQSPFQISESGDTAARLRAVGEYAGILRAEIADYQPLNQEEHTLCRKILALIPSHADRQKAHLVAVNARHMPAWRHVQFFIRNRRKHDLKFSWLLYSLYARWNILKYNRKKSKFVKRFNHDG